MLRSVSHFVQTHLCYRCGTSIQRTPGGTATINKPANKFHVEYIYITGCNLGARVISNGGVLCSVLQRVPP